ncbi:MAG: hypothetical protein PHE21_00960 [Candidatus Dojkabacteria bacterium]|nr:hypothetical protein [Candidatus Dojkabacteria bacterium]
MSKIVIGIIIVVVVVFIIIVWGILKPKQPDDYLYKDNHIERIRKKWRL